jgi:hypothetical protein
MGEKPVLKTSILMFVAFFTAYLIPYFGLFLFGGQETELIKSIFYYATGGGALLGLLSLSTLNSFVNKGILPRKKWGWLNVLIYEPKDTIFYDLGGVWRKFIKFNNIFHFAILLSLSLSLFSAVTQTSFVSLPLTEFQATETGLLILNTEPAATTETVLLLVLVSLFYGMIVWLKWKFNLPWYAVFLLILVFSFLGMAVWTGIHFARYGAEETKLIATATFGFVGTFITLVTGTIIIWYFWHFFGNFFGKAVQLFSSEGVVLTVIVLIVIYSTILLISRVLQYQKTGDFL